MNPIFLERGVSLKNCGQSRFDDLGEAARSKIKTMKKSEIDFLKALQAQAAKQSVVYTKRILPEQLDFFTSFIGTYPWQVMIVSSGLVAAILEML